MVSILERFVDKYEKNTKLLKDIARSFCRLPSCVIHCFTGNREQAIKYLQLGCYIGLTGYLWKDKSENGVRRILEEGVIPLDKLLVETDAPFMYPNTRASKLPQHIKDCLTERSVTFLQRYCTFQVSLERWNLEISIYPIFSEKRAVLPSCNCWDDRCLLEQNSWRGGPGHYI